MRSRDAKQAEGRGGEGSFNVRGLEAESLLCGGKTRPMMGMCRRVGHNPVLREGSHQFFSAKICKFCDFGKFGGFSLQFLSSFVFSFIFPMLWDSRVVR